MGAGSSVLDRGQVLERGVLALVIVLPIADPEPSIKQAVKAVEVQTLVTEPRVERLNGNSSQRLPGRSLEQPGSCACPDCNSIGDEFGRAESTDSGPFDGLAAELLDGADMCGCDMRVNVVGVR